MTLTQDQPQHASAGGDLLAVTPLGRFSSTSLPLGTGLAVGTRVPRKSGSVIAALKSVAALAFASPFACSFGLPSFSTGLKSFGRAAVGAHPDRAAVALESLLAAPVVSIWAPNLDGVIIGAGEEHILLRVPPHRLHVLSMRLQKRNTLVFVRLLGVVDPDRAVAAAGCKELTRGAIGHRLHLVLVAAEHGGTLHAQAAWCLGSWYHLPHGDGGIEGGHCQLGAVHIPSQGPHGAAVVL
eukprot:CAMPEP_0181418088 /NCGR_PEP_ID=MMETSP1110-20121109/11374_1 /TAXON_ID=174948 /ORGANISM="Symbiodinium sp., Strain CCMP421" /LENGTH=238 /DNA_ID=CAMNT_0023541055 /DNA_START=176 /DNA_END=892 /DNA_ORIENTATION=-